MEENKKNGILESTLKQTFKQIKESRVQAMVEDTELKYRREIEDLALKIRQCDRDLEDAILDILPTNAISGINPNSFNTDSFKDSRVQTLLIKRENCIKLSVIIKDYETLFGEYKDIDKVKEYLNF